MIAGIWRDGKGLAFALGYGDRARGGGDLAVLVGGCGNDTHFIDLDLQQMRSMRRIGVPSTDTVICTEIEWRIGLFAIHNMITEHHYKIVVIIALIGAAFISRVFRLCNGNGIMLAVHILNFHIARCGRKALLFFRASRAVQSVLSVPERYFVKPVVLKVNIILVSALILLQQWMIDLNTDRVLLAVADGHGEGLVGIDQLGFPIHKVRDCGRKDFILAATGNSRYCILVSFQILGNVQNLIVFFELPATAGHIFISGLRINRSAGTLCCGQCIRIIEFPESGRIIQLIPKRLAVQVQFCFIGTIKGDFDRIG